MIRPFHRARWLALCVAGCACQLLSSLHHPNIVKFFGVAMPSASFVYVVTELCLSDLDRAMCSSLSAAGCTAPTMWHSFARQIASAVSYLHARNIIHRDLKPANVLITNSGTSGCTAKICDFGISKQASGDSGPFAATHTGMLGTPAYMAPEVFMGRSLKASYSKAVDVYSFGILLWAMWTGNLPYDDVPGSVYAMLKAIEDGRRPVRVFNALRELSDDQGVAGQADCSSGFKVLDFGRCESHRSMPDGHSHLHSRVGRATAALERAQSDVLSTCGG